MNNDVHEMWLRRNEAWLTKHSGREVGRVDSAGVEAFSATPLETFNRELFEFLDNSNT